MVFCPHCVYKGVGNAQPRTDQRDSPPAPGDGPEGSSPAAASADGRRQRGPIRKLRNVPPRRAADRNRVGAVDARTEHEEIRRIGARVYGGIRAGEERRQRTFHRSEPGEVEGHDGAPAGQDAAVRVADATQRHSKGSRWWLSWASVKTGEKRY